MCLWTRLSRRCTLLKTSQASRSGGRRGGRLKEAEDLLDSIVCAYSVLYAWYHGPRYYAVYGTPPAVDKKESGHILVPMAAGMWKRIKTSRLLIPDRDGTI